MQGATLTIYSNDTDEPSIYVSVTGTVSGSGLAISPLDIQFGDVYIGSSNTEIITITNTGENSLLVTDISSDNGNFSVSQSSMTVPGGENKTVTIIFSPLQPGEQYGNVAITTNEGEFNVSVYGNAQDSGRTLQITSPKDGEVLAVGRQYDIQWTGSGLTDVRIEFSSDGGDSWSETTSSVPVQNSQYSWTVPDYESDNCIIRLSDVTDPGFSSMSGLFNISKTSFSISHEPVVEAQENSSITFDASIYSNTTIDRVVLYYDVTGRRVFDNELEMTHQGGDYYSGALSVGIFTAKGLEYYIIASDINDGEVREPESGTLYSVKANVAEVASTETTSGGSEQNSYRMISIPLVLNDTHIDNQLINSLPKGEYGSDWRLFRYSPGSEFAQEYPDIEGFAPGKAFWIISRSNFTLRSLQGTTVSTNEPFFIELAAGWNDIANPWMFDVSWNDVENPSGADLSVLYSYDGSWSDPVINPPTVLKPWNGYAVNNLTNMTVIVKLNPKPATESEKPVVTKHFDWMLTLKATAGEARDMANHLGVSEKADMEWDHYDHVEPPPVGEYVSVSFPHHDWNKYPYDYTVDFRPPGDTVSWDFNVRTNITGETIRVELEGIEKLPDDTAVTIYDRDTGRKINIFDNTFNFSSTNDVKESHFTLVASSSLEKQPDQDNAIPEQLVTAVSYPNPFNPQTTIQYEMSHPAKVSVLVFNSLGRRVRVYEFGYREQGIHELVFDATDLTSGLYFYQINAGYASVTGKMLYMK
ncbi:MAG: choice-of-anchor D domain-containing protein [Candidatus Latescibacteria bacterium]|nr:choice-of-anchor D domain-containing protein [Candidatus Latescibacterota bacterium]